MAKLTLNGSELEAPEGAPLVEVIKNSGTFISNLCYVDGLPAYAGCRTCLVDIEGARGLQLSCTTRVADGMIVRTDTQEAKSTRQAVLSLILSYHSDRCLTCHRVVKCKPGDTCLRDGVVTHRCLTCSKNYRCELQTTCEMLEMAGYEPWDGDDRTYYNIQQPEPDQANPFLEFDPQMCIICTRCVRACDEIRHTGAITLAGRGFSTRIAFGAGGQVHESNCDFCGSCIDVCPTATLMEHPNKWGATQTERWMGTTCTQCSVGCSISLGSKKGRGVIVRPDMTANPVSGSQLCVRGRFHYDAVKPSQRLQTPLIRRNGPQHAASWEEALAFAVERLAQIREEHGPDSIGFLGSPLASNEENYLVSKIARAVIGTNNVDSTAGAVARAAAGSLRAAFGSEVLPADLRRIAKSRTVLVVAGDLESSHNIAALRVKDAVVGMKAKLVVISPVWGELCDFADVWIRPRPGDEAVAVTALDGALVSTNGSELDEFEETLRAAAAVLSAASRQSDMQPVSVVYALPHFGASETKAITAALANIAITCAGDSAADALFLLPQSANVWGMRDMGGSPELLPAYRAVADEGARKEMERLWGAPIPAASGLSFDDMIAGGKLRALVVMNDNPLMLAPPRANVRKALEALDFLAVVDSLPTDTAKQAHVVLPDVPAWSKEGTTTSADRRVLRLHEGAAAQGEARQGWRILCELGSLLAARLNPGEIRINFQSASEVMAEIAEVVPLYRDCTYREMDSGAQQHLHGLGPRHTERQDVPALAAADGGGFRLMTSRTLFTSYEAAAIHSPDADRLHREEAVSINPEDAATLGLSEGDTVVLHSRGSDLRLKAHLTEAVLPKALHAPLLHDGGAVVGLFDGDSSAVSVNIAKG